MRCISVYLTVIGQTQFAICVFSWNGNGWNFFLLFVCQNWPIGNLNIPGGH